MRWKEEFTKHPIHTTIKMLDEAANLKLKIDTSLLESERVRFEKFSRYLRDAVKQVDPDLAPIDLLTQVNNTLNSHNVLNTLTALIRSQNPELLRELNSQVAPSLSYVAQLASATRKRDTSRIELEAATESLERFSQRSEQRIIQVEELATSIEKRLATSTAIFEEIVEKNRIISDEFQERVRQWNAQQSETLLQVKSDFSKEQIEIRKEGSAAILAAQESVKKELLNYFEEQKTTLSQERLNMQGTLDTLIQEAQQKHLQILDFYKLTAVDSVTGGHKNIADREYTSARNWRYMTLASVSAAALWILLSIFCFQPVLEPPRLFWLSIAKSLSLTAILVSFAVYASKQSSLHRRNEAKARAFFLQVQAFDPFVASLPIEKQTELKEALSTRIFGVDNSDQGAQPMAEANLDGLERLLDVGEKLKKLVSRS